MANFDTMDEDGCMAWLLQQKQEPLRTLIAGHLRAREQFEKTRSALDEALEAAGHEGVGNMIACIDNYKGASLSQSEKQAVRQ